METISLNKRDSKHIIPSYYTLLVTLLRLHLSLTFLHLVGLLPW